MFPNEHRHIPVTSKGGGSAQEVKLSLSGECNKFLQRSTNTSSEEVFDILKSMEKLMIFDKEHAALVFSGVVSVPMESWNDTGI